MRCGNCGESRGSFCFKKIPGGVRVKGKRGTIEIFTPVGTMQQANRSSDHGIHRNHHRSSTASSAYMIGWSDEECLGRHAEKERINHAVSALARSLSTPAILVEGAAGWERR